MSENNGNQPSKISIGVLTVSDRAFSGEYQDRGGPAILSYLESHIASMYQVVSRVVPDERPVIEEALIDLSSTHVCCLILTTGGTGPAPRDVTPEATQAVCDKMMPGFGELMRATSIAMGIKTAILSRQTAGLRGSCLIVNLPGSPKAIPECLDPILPAIPHCIRLAGGPGIELTPTPAVTAKNHTRDPKDRCEGCGIIH